jgi:hypothetical protein
LFNKIIIIKQKEKGKNVTNKNSISGDRVANIQLEVCSLLCPLKETLRLPHDRQLLHSLESCVGQLLLSAKDRDVNAALAMAIQQLDKIELPASQHDIKVNIQCHP